MTEDELLARADGIRDVLAGYETTAELEKACFYDDLTDEAGAITIAGRRRLAELEAPLDRATRVTLEALRAGIQITLGLCRWIVEDPPRLVAFVLDTLDAHPVTAETLFRAIYFVQPNDARIRIVEAYVRNPDPDAVPALFRRWAPYRYDRPGPDPDRAFLPREAWIALMRRGLADERTRLDAIRLIYMTAIGDEFLDDLVVYSDAADATMRFAIEHALRAASSDRAKAELDKILLR